MSLETTSQNSRRDLDKAALRGEPSYVWRAGQERRLKMVLDAAGDCINGVVLDNGCGVGMYLTRLAKNSQMAIGLEYDFERASEAHQRSNMVVNSAGEGLPFPDGSINFILSHEVLEHVQDDHLAAQEMVRVLRPSGRLALFVPNRGYPFETHGIYWRGEYRFGNIPLVNYLPRRLRDRLAPHVRVYTSSDLRKLFAGMPVLISQHEVIFGAYDNVIVRYPKAGKALRAILQWLEKTPLKIFGLSHFWVIEKV